MNESTNRVGGDAERYGSFIFEKFAPGTIGPVREAEFWPPPPLIAESLNATHALFGNGLFFEQSFHRGDGLPWENRICG
jgi:hypothetical protein